MKKTGWPRKRIFYCPEGVHSNFWTNDTIPNKKYKSHNFTFFYNGDWSYRKGIDTLIRAYSKAFSPTEPVRLLLLVHYQGNGEKTSRQVIGTELKDICNRAGIYRLPKIEFIFGHISDPEMPSVFKCADVYVCPTRGEAWGLPIIQAMSCGVPAVIPEWGGQTDYCNKKNSFLIKTEKFDTIHDKVNLEVDFYRYQQFCFPDENHLIELMRYCYQHPDESKNKGQIAAEHVRKNFSWTNSARIAERRLLEIYKKKFN
jgi:glycosyltransferase involved in cell wall biosynthesis